MTGAKLRITPALMIKIARLMQIRSECTGKKGAPGDISDWALAKADRIRRAASPLAEAAKDE